MGKTPYISLGKINIDAINNKYNFTIYKEKNKNNNSASQQKTKLMTNLTNNSNKLHFSYIDEAKTENICQYVFKTENDEFLKKNETMCCFWCRHPFDFKILSCPIEFICHKVYKQYYSEISKNKFLLQESINTNHLLHEKTSTNPENIEIKKQLNGYYLSDGIFCSFNCLLSFIHENKHVTLYSQSENLTNKIYYDLFPEGLSIVPAPHWRMLSKYGGTMSIEDFRKSFNKVEYLTKNDYVKDIPSFKNIGFIFEKKIKL